MTKYGICKYNYKYKHKYYDDNKLNYINLPLYYFNGYKAVDINNNQQLFIFKDLNSQISVVLPTNDAEINIYFDPPLLWRISNYISLISILVFIIYLNTNNIKKILFFKNNKL